MGENPWKSASSLKNEKLGLTKEFQGNHATREGQRLEPIAREAFMKQHGCFIQPAIVQAGDTPFIAASLDGINSKDSIVAEIKCGLKSYEYVASKKSVPNYYRAQLQHILLVTGFKAIFYVAFRPDMKLIVLEVKRDKNYIKTLAETEMSFANSLRLSGHTLASKHRGIRT